MLRTIQLTDEQISLVHEALSALGEPKAEEQCWLDRARETSKIQSLQDEMDALHIIEKILYQAQGRSQA